VYLTSMTYEHGAFEYAYERCTGAYSSFDRGVYRLPRAAGEPAAVRLSQRDERALSVPSVLAAPEVPDVQRRDDFHLVSAMYDREPRAEMAAVRDGQ